MFVKGTAARPRRRIAPAEEQLRRDQVAFGRQHELDGFTGGDVCQYKLERSQDGEARAHSGQFVTRMAPAQVAAFYRQTLSAQGYAERTGDSFAGLLVFEKGGSVVSVAAQALQEDAGAAVFVNRREGSP